MTTPTDALTCKELVELVTDYFEGALPSEERVRFEEHIASCRGCRTYVEQMRQTIDTLGRLTEDDVEPAAREDLLGIFRDWKRTR